MTEQLPMGSIAIQHVGREQLYGLVPCRPMEEEVDDEEDEEEQGPFFAHACTAPQKYSYKPQGGSKWRDGFKKGERGDRLHIVL